ncbi:hypothetical protein BDZ91DRAFT_664725, partial [Kalaharituber pfeilii]
RGTFDVLTSCILTLVLCVWTAVHPDIPSQTHRGFWYSLMTRSWWVVSGLIAPEFLLWQAFEQYLAARRICKCLADLGRIAIPLPRANQVKTKNGPVPPVFQLSPDTVISLLNAGAIKLDSDVFDEERIKDKSKADNLAKLLVCGQASWMVVQCIARKITGLPVTLLEINTVMHVICALLLYLIWLKKPQEVNVPNNVTDSTPDGVLSLVLSAIRTENLEASLAEKGLYWREGASMVFLLGLTSLYGSIHLIPWNSHFPTALERYLWRASCCVIAGGVPAFWVVVLLLIVIDHCLCCIESGKLKQVVHHCMQRIVLFGFILYTLARIFVFIEAFASLRSLPQGAYDIVPWTEFWPHF